MSKSSEFRPNRLPHLVTESVGDELLVYNPLGECHCLASEVAAIFRECTGERTESELNAHFSELEEGVVSATLTNFLRLGLIAPATPPLTKRRDFLKVSAAALPAILTLGLPLPSAAASGTCNPAASCTACAGVPTCGDACDGCVGGTHCCLDLYLISTGGTAGVTACVPDNQGTAVCFAGVAVGASQTSIFSAETFCCGIAGCFSTASCEVPPGGCVCPAGALGGIARCGDAGTDGARCCGGNLTCTQATSTCA